MFCRKILLSMIFVTVVLVISGRNAGAELSFAILPLESSGEVSAADKEDAESSFYQYLIDSKKYKIIERSRIAEIMKEQAFQMTGATDQTQAVAIGKVLGVEKLVAPKLYLKNQNQPALNVSVIDVATAQVEFSKEASYAGYRASDLSKFCASFVISEYPLLGKILGIVKDVLVVSLGKNNGLKVGDRLFVAREELLKDETGEVLFREVNRVGLLEVSKLDAARAQVKIRTLVDPKNPLQKDDLVSPEPIPKQAPLISTQPLLPEMTKGKLLLEDDMEQRQYLASASNAGDDYIGGKLHLNAMQLTSGQVYCYYPAPFDNLENFIMEGVVGFQPIKWKYNRFSVVIRNTGEYPNSSSYNFFWNNQGSFSINQWRLGTSYTLAPLQSSPAIRRGEGENTFRVVAFGSKFDFYLNDEFVIGFSDELLEKGQIGFMAEAYGYVTVDNVKLWEIAPKSTE